MLKTVTSKYFFPEFFDE